jgi:endoglucanase
MKLSKSIFLFLLFTKINVVYSQLVSPFIAIDQFGYTTASNKIAVLRDPQVGFDEAESYTPGNLINLVDVTTENTIYSSAPIEWNSGNTDVASGDKIWWFDFSSITTEGIYYILDTENNAKSYNFVISDTVYSGVLKAALKTFYYQRVGIEKAAEYAGAGWADNASHIGELQDANCRFFSTPNNVNSEKNLTGGWYDAGDYNKYTSWTANYIIILLKAYKENTTIWGDDSNIPESGNGVPDILDEVKWGLDWLLKMQQPNGSSLCVMGLDYGSPPSSADGQSLYGPATTNASLKSAAAFALGSKYLKEANAVLFSEYADTLQSRAILAWNWGIENPSIKFSNNSEEYGSVGLAAGDQETDSLGRFITKMAAALYLFQLTEQSNYIDVFEAGISEFPLFDWNNFISQYFQESQDLLFDYIGLPEANATIVDQIKIATLSAAQNENVFIDALVNEIDPYRAFIEDYNWGSNQYKSIHGNFFWQLQNYDVDQENNTIYLKAAEEYLHYIHGLNPMQLVYLSNMGSYGADNNIKEFYHSWFEDGSELWDKEGSSTYGPAPGFLTGGPNTYYELDGCCPDNCGSAENNALCTTENLSPPIGQPPMKAYKDFNTNWPQNSWQITENSNGYQVAYIRLLSKFVKNNLSTSITDNDLSEKNVTIYPNPSNDEIYISLPNKSIGAILEIYNSIGNLIQTTKILHNEMVGINNITNGAYYLKIIQGENTYSKKLVKLND